ncbi:fungal pheromone STE3G-protein-coupled receptor [Thelephora ganbajun]|uniref:Fungal pheromone STE3G-protein-coupled receptor n=1 Tax=Thelephora ganbajun TaxID=370292 RepID=A0ACB6ZCG3_THEGA|nr:fungal pheromone STE3G-protein-coupled receptor [Thelephora ganbajun]
MTRIELPVVSFLAVLSLFVVLPLHLRSRNFPFLFVIAWLLVSNIIQGTDAIIWADDALIRAEGWCDVVTFILYALRVALPAAALCVCRQLEIVSSTLDVSYDPRKKYFTSVFHYVMCLAVPVIYAILHFVVQDRRFVLVQEFGCQAAIYPSVPALFLTWFIPLVFCMITVFYAGLSFYNYYRRCSFFNQHLNPRSKMTTAMFFRFVGFCLFTVLLVAFANIFDMSSLIGESGLLEYTSWSAVHQDNLTLVISKEDTSQFAAGVRVRTEVTWWMAPIVSFVLAAVFASTKECWIAGQDFCITTKKRTRGLFTPKQKFDLPIQYVRLFPFRSFLSPRSFFDSVLIPLRSGGIGNWKVLRSCL